MAVATAMFVGSPRPSVDTGTAAPCVQDASGAFSPASRLGFLTATGPVHFSDTYWSRPHDRGYGPCVCGYVGIRTWNVWTGTRCGFDLEGPEEATTPGSPTQLQVARVKGHGGSPLSFFLRWVCVCVCAWN